VKIEILDEAQQDLIAGFHFYGRKEKRCQEPLSLMDIASNLNCYRPSRRRDEPTVNFRRLSPLT
jgi:hypothetical protein